MVTGYNPGQHGVYSLATYAQRGTTWRPATAANRRKDPFWRLLSVAGQRMGMINVPITYPAPGPWLYVKWNGHAGRPQPRIRSSP